MEAKSTDKRLSYEEVFTDLRAKIHDKGEEDVYDKISSTGKKGLNGYHRLRSKSPNAAIDLLDTIDKAIERLYKTLVLSGKTCYIIIRHFTQVNLTTKLS